MTRAALDPPSEPVVRVSNVHVERALAASRASERKRIILPFHKSHADPLHRMLNAAQPGTYVQPHRHQSVPKAEIFLVLRGAIDVLIFSETGEIQQAHYLKAGSNEFGVDIAPGLFHSFLVRATDTVLYEIKCGPYTGMNDKDFAAFAPAEGSPEVAAYVARLEQAILTFRDQSPLPPGQ